jgi:hypothetical protein
VSHSAPAPSKRGRPPKFGRASQPLSLTLPEDIVEWLRERNTDIAWAIVRLCEQEARRTRAHDALIEFLHLPNRQALILIRTPLVRHLGDVEVLPLSDGRGLLVFGEGKGTSDLELTLADQMERPNLSPTDREEITALWSQLREWRQQGVRFERRAIVVATGVPRRRKQAASKDRS